MSITIFNFGKLQVRTQMINNEPWFSAQDVCAALDIVNHKDAVSRLDADEYAIGITDNFTPGVGISDPSLDQNRNILVVNEPGLYRLIFTSRKEEAKKFKRWIFHVALPTLRKTGELKLAKVVEDIPEHLDSIELRLSEINAEMQRSYSVVKAVRKLHEPKKMDKKAALSAAARTVILNLLDIGPTSIRQMMEHTENLGPLAYELEALKHEGLIRLITVEEGLSAFNPIYVAIR